ncbi:hypothetical protein C3L33_18939, partial [Rhododendron williamsianum]
MKPGGREERNKESEAQTETVFSQFPDEIILWILSKLPAKSLLRFRCVSKHWSYLISDPSFKFSVQRQQVVVVPTTYHPRYSIRMIDDEASVMELPKPKALVDIESICGMRIRGSCNGFLLLNAGNELFLWNPMTRCSKKGKVESGPTVSGRLHWLVSGSAREEDKFPRQQLIIYFDPQTNEFAEVPMPQCER